METRDIGGRWQRPASSATIDVVSPHTEEVIGTVPDGTPADMDAAVAAARDAFDNTDWAAQPAAERAEVLQRLADLYAARLTDIADLITAEMGSPTTYSRAAQAPGPLLMLTTNLELAKSYPWEERRPGNVRLRGARPPGSDRGRRRDRTVERAAVRGDQQARPGPERLPTMEVGHLFGIEARLAYQAPDGPWPTRYWARCTDALPTTTASSHACALAYISDTLTALMPLTDPPARHGPTLSQSIWLHRSVNLDDWVMIDLKRISVSRGIGCYRGSVYDSGRQLVASLTQEAVFQLLDPARTAGRRGSAAADTAR